MPKSSSVVSFKENLRRVLFKDSDFRAEFMNWMKLALHEIVDLATREDIQSLREEIRLWRDQSNERFQAMDERFAATQKETETLRRESNERFAAMQEEMKRGFETAHQETQDLRRDMDERFAAAQKETQDLRRDMDERFEKQGRETHRLLSALGGRWGPDIEGTFRALTKELVEKRYGGTVQKWRRYIPEEKREEEIDLVLHNGEVYAVEIKASVSKRELYGFLQACRAYETLEGKTLSRKILASPYVHPSVQALAQREGAEVFTGEEDN